MRINKAKNSALKLNDFQKVLEANQVLLFQYINNNDLLKAIATIDEILDNTQIKSDKSYIDYLLSIKMQILIEVGEYRKALRIVELFLSDLRYRGSEDYLKYYYARCLYDCGDIDSAYNETIGIIKKIKKTSLKGNSNQKIYPQIYSLMASIQNHLNLDNDEIKYYKLALNYSFNLIDDKALYFDILSKCDMFFSIEKSQLELTKCAAYYQKTGNKFKSAKVYFNLATELLFNRSDVDNEIEYLFKIAKNTFNIPDENLAYVKNNIAIYYILVKNDLPSAIIELESALFVNLSEFTYMTIFLNLSMSYFIAYGGNNEKFKKTYEQFLKYEKLVEKRKNRTKYEIMYRIICDLIFSSHSKNYTDYICNKYSAQCSDFFKPILNDIKKRNHGDTTEKSYKKNTVFYKTINEKKLFLAEFRFWN